MAELKDLSELAPNVKNPRRISKFDFDNLVKSIKEFGDLSGVIFNIQTQQLVGGHQRVEAFRSIQGDKKIVYSHRHYNEPDSKGEVARGYVQIGDSKFPYREVSWPLDREQAANIAANRIQGEFDLDLLAEISYELSQSSPDLLALTGQSDEELSDLMDMSGLADSTLTEEDEAPEVDEEAEPESKPGEIYQLGPHRLMCGDATNEEHVKALTGGQKADMVFTDPPLQHRLPGRRRQQAQGHHE